MWCAAHPGPAGAAADVFGPEWGARRQVSGRQRGYVGASSSHLIAAAFVLLMDCFQGISVPRKQSSMVLRAILLPHCCVHSFAVPVSSIYSTRNSWRCLTLEEMACKDRLCTSKSLAQGLLGQLLTHHMTTARCTALGTFVCHPMISHLQRFPSPIPHKGPLPIFPPDPVCQ